MLRNTSDRVAFGAVALLAVLTVFAFFCPSSAMQGAGFSGTSGVIASTGLSDSANLARLNAANTFTNANIIAPSTDVIPLVVKGAGNQHCFEVRSADNTALFDIQGDNYATNIRHDAYVYGFIYMLGALTAYKNTATAGLGVPAIYASGRQEAVSAAAASSIATFTPAADGSFLVSGNVLVTTAGAIAATMTVTYTDEGNTGRTATLPFTLVAGTPLTAIAFANGNVPYEGVPLRIRVKGGTAITVQTAGTFTSSVYNCEADIIQVK